MAMTALSESSTFSQLRKMVTNKADVFRISARLNVNPSTIKKILEGNPISRGVRRKIDAAFEKGAKSSPIRMRRSTVERLLEAYHLYQEEGTLQAVGRRIGVSRERVRQLLKQGSELGLFEYKPLDYPLVGREKILEDYKKFLKRDAVARANHISLPHLHKLLASYQITEKELRSLRISGRQQKCIDKYYSIVRELGHHPTTTELQRLKSVRYLLTRIRRLWGSFSAFRKELNVPPLR